MLFFWFSDRDDLGALPHSGGAFPFSQFPELKMSLIHSNGLLSRFRMTAFVIPSVPGAVRFLAACAAAKNFGPAYGSVQLIVRLATLFSSSVVYCVGIPRWRGAWVGFVPLSTPMYRSLNFSITSSFVPVKSSAMRCILLLFSVFVMVVSSMLSNVDHVLAVPSVFWSLVQNCARPSSDRFAAYSLASSDIWAILILV